MKNTYFGTFATEAEKLNAMRYEIMEAGCGRCGDSDEMLRRFWETLESGLPLVVEDEDGMVEAEYANIFCLIADMPAATTIIEPADGKWLVYIAD